MLEACEFVLAILVAVEPVSVAGLLRAGLVLAHPLASLHSPAAALGAVRPRAPPAPLGGLLLDAAESDLECGAGQGYLLILGRLYILYIRTTYRGTVIELCQLSFSIQLAVTRRSIQGDKCTMGLYFVDFF